MPESGQSNSLRSAQIHRHIASPPLNAMMERARMSEMDIYHRTRDIFHHYKLPFDAPPPEE